MADPETGYRWWIRYVAVPLLGAGGAIAAFVTYITRSPHPLPAPQPASAAAAQPAPSQEGGAAPTQPRQTLAPIAPAAKPSQPSPPEADGKTLKARQPAAEGRADARVLVSVRRVPKFPLGAQVGDQLGVGVVRRPDGSLNYKQTLFDLEFGVTQQVSAGIAGSALFERLLWMQPLDSPDARFLIEQRPAGAGDLLAACSDDLVSKLAERMSLTWHKTAVVDGPIDRDTTATFVMNKLFPKCDEEPQHYSCPKGRSERVATYLFHFNDSSAELQAVLTTMRYGIFPTGAGERRSYYNATCYLRLSIAPKTK